jgi:hypothetical protein
VTAQASPVKTLEKAASTVQDTAAKIVEAVDPTKKKQDLDNVILLQGTALASEAAPALRVHLPQHCKWLERAT